MIIKIFKFLLFVVNFYLIHNLIHLFTFILITGLLNMLFIDFLKYFLDNVFLLIKLLVFQLLCFLEDSKFFSLVYEDSLKFILV